MKLTRQILALILIAIIGLSSIVVMQRMLGSSGVDLTEDQLYSLSDGTKNIIGAVNQPMTFNLYYARTAALKGSDQLRFWNNYYLYVRDLLEEYVAQSGGSITLKLIDPRPYSDAEEQALRYGIQKIPISQDESFYFGLALTNEAGRDKVIKFFEPQRQELVEYDISKNILELMQRETRSIGVISSLPIMGDDLSPYMRQMMQMQGQKIQESWGFISHLKQAYELQFIEGEKGSLPAGLDYLLVVHPKELPKKMLFAIDQFVMGGGKLIVLQDPHCFMDRPVPDPQNPYAAMQHKSSSNLNALTSAWGVTLQENAIAVDRHIARATPLGPGRAAELFLPLLGLNQESVNPDEVISAKLNELSFLFAGSLQSEAKEGVEIRPLLTTTDSGNIWQPKSPFELTNINPAVINRAYKDGTEPIVLAALLQGELRSNFPEGIEVEKEGGDAKDAETKKEKLTAIASAQKGAAVVVIADVDFISDNFAYQNTLFGLALRGQNSSLLLNSLEYLGGNEDLISIRSRARFQRPFTVVDEIEKAAEERTATAIEEINARIQSYEQRLQQLGSQASDATMGLIQNEALRQRQEVEADIRTANRQLRNLKNQRRVELEELKSSLKLQNILGAPVVIMLIAFILWIVRLQRARRYAARRN